MRRFQQTRTTANSIHTGLALPDWLNGKRKPNFEEIEKYVENYPNRKVHVNKAIIKVLMDHLVDLQKQSGITRSKVV